MLDTPSTEAKDPLTNCILAFRLRARLLAPSEVYPLISPSPISFLASTCIAGNWCIWPILVMLILSLRKASWCRPVSWSSTFTDVWSRTESIWRRTGTALWSSLHTAAGGDPWAMTHKNRSQRHSESSLNSLPWLIRPDHNLQSDQCKILTPKISWSQRWYLPLIRCTQQCAVRISYLTAHSEVILRLEQCDNFIKSGWLIYAQLQAMILAIYSAMTNMPPSMPIVFIIQAKHGHPKTWFFASKL